MYCGGQDAASALKNGKLVRSLQFYVLAKLPQMTKLVPVRYAQTDSLRFPFLKSLVSRNLPKTAAIPRRGCRGETPGTWHRPQRLARV